LLESIKGQFGFGVDADKIKLRQSDKNSQIIAGAAAGCGGPIG
jgi:hypothetical protein